MKKVIIIQEVFKQYRLPLFQELSTSLSKKNISLKILYSLPSDKESSKNDNITNLDNALFKKVPAHRFFGGKLVYQQCLKEIANADLIIIEHANRHILNYFIYIARLFGVKFLFWGHGYNHQSKNQRLLPFLKKSTVNLSNGWLCYTDTGKKYIESIIGTKKPVVSLNNSIDTSALRAEVSKYRDSEYQDPYHGVFIGSLYKEKEIDFLIDSAIEISKNVPEFSLTIAGAGPEAYKVEAACKTHKFIKYSGAIFGADKAKLLARSSFFLNPGLTGLAVLDAFTAELPFFTTEYPYHSPEIDYVETDKNGLITEFTVNDYSRKVSDIISTPDKFKLLQEGAKKSSLNYSISNMALNYSTGILIALGQSSLN